MTRRVLRRVAGVAVAASGHELWAAEVNGPLTAPWVSANWQPSDGEFYGEVALVEIDPSTGRGIRRIPEPQLGSGNYWMGLTANAGTVALDSDGPLLLIHV